MELHIVNAEESHRGEWLAMRKALWPGDDQGHSDAIDEFFTGTSTSIEGALLAQVDDKILGFVELNIREHVDGSSMPCVPYLEAWFVKPDSRKQGVGRELITAAEEWSREMGFAELASDTPMDNLSGIQAHEKLGFRETGRVVTFIKTFPSR